MREDVIPQVADMGLQAEGAEWVIAAGIVGVDSDTVMAERVLTWLTTHTKPGASRFMAGKVGMTLESIERLAEYLDLELVKRPWRGRKGR